MITINYLKTYVSLEAKIIEEGKVAQGEYDEYAEWCEDTSKDLQYEIKTGKAEVSGTPYLGDR